MGECNEAVMTGGVCTFMGVRFTHSCTCSLKGKQCSKFGTVIKESYVDIVVEVMKQCKFSQNTINNQVKHCERGTFNKQEFIDLIQKGRFNDELSPEYIAEILKRLESAN